MSRPADQDPSLRNLTLTLDGVPVTFTAGETLYEVAQRHGKVIPTLCYDPRLEPFGACRLCAVEVRGARAPVASCTTLAVVDMDVHTHSPALENYRRILLEMVASENPRTAVDPLSGYSSQELRLLVEQYGADTGRFAGAHSGHARLDDPNPFIRRDYDLCISCYRCVRVCAEQEGDYAISIANRGFHTQITVEFDGVLKQSACTFCGQCVQTCPTGALGDRKALRFAEEPASGSR
jgi:NADH dehydrogenase/NADH:ubiquinone oxidoreductase subunit G